MSTARPTIEPEVEGLIDFLVMKAKRGGLVAAVRAISADGLNKIAAALEGETFEPGTQSPAMHRVAVRGAVRAVLAERRVSRRI